MFRSSRDRKADATLGPRVAIFAVGAVLGLAGIAFDRGWLVSAAIVVLAAGMIAGWRGRRAETEGDDTEANGP